jgi:integration host factor subunit alpha
MAALTKSQLIENLVSKKLFRKGESAHFIENLFELMRQSLEQGEDVLITGFGKFCVREKPDRVGRNPKTGEPLPLPSRRVVTFRCSDLLREKMKQNGATSQAEDPSAISRKS